MEQNKNELYELKKNIAVLNTAVQELNNIIQKLEKQASIISNQIGENEGEYEEKTAVMQAYTAIKQSIHLHNPHHARRKIYDTDIRNCMEAITKSMNIIRQQQSVEKDDDFSAYSRIIRTCLNEYNLKLSSLTSSFLPNLDALCNVLNRDYLKEEVAAMFIQNPEDLIAV